MASKLNVVKTFSLAESFREKTKTTLYFFGFVLEVSRYFFSFRKNARISKLVIFRQILFTGFEALSLISLAAIAISGIMIIEGNSMLPGFGQSKMFYSIFVSVVTRELSCLLTAIIIIARSGTAISTELGNMVINHEIDSLLSIGISPISYLIIPRVLGVLISIITLSIYFNTIATLSGWAINNLFFSINIAEYYNRIISEITIRDVFASLLKSTLFGFFIAIVASYEGLKVVIASTEVPQRTIKAVVRSLTAIIIIDAAVTILFYF